jgi:FkbM family methyltransferase
MKNWIFNFFKLIFKVCNLGIIRYSSLQKLIADSNELDKISFAPLEIELIKRLNKECSTEILNYWEQSKSQLRQDLFVLSHFLFKKNGYFVEFGATNGFDLSNTYLLEKKFSWTGILAEPAKCWHDELYVNRKCNIETNCVWTVSGIKIPFLEVADKELSTVIDYQASDIHALKRNQGITYDVNTISLNDMLKKHNAPTHIDYLSIDTEGSEYDILKNLSFDKYSFGIITVEHNYSSNRKNINDLLTSFGYKRVFDDLSLFDDWYIGTNFK